MFWVRFPSSSFHPQCIVVVICVFLWWWRRRWWRLAYTSPTLFTAPPFNRVLKCSCRVAVTTYFTRYFTAPPLSNRMPKRLFVGLPLLFHCPSLQSHAKMLLSGCRYYVTAPPLPNRMPKRFARLPFSSGGREKQGRRSKPPLPLSPLASDSWSPPDWPEHARSIDCGGEEPGEARSAASALPEVPSIGAAAAAVSQPPLPPAPPARTGAPTTTGVCSSSLGSEEEKERRSGRPQQRRGGADSGTEPATTPARAAEAAATVAVTAVLEHEEGGEGSQNQQPQQRQQNKQQPAQEGREDEEGASPNRVTARRLVQSFLASRYTFFGTLFACAVAPTGGRSSSWLSLSRVRPGGGVSGISYYLPLAG